MPRIKSRRKIYKSKDLGSWVAGKMREKHLTQKIMADELGISQPAYGKKLEKSQFTYFDLITIFEKLEISDDDILEVMKA